MFNKLICPDCNESLIKKKNRILCNKCKRKFKIIEGIPVILPKKLSKFKKIEINFYEKEFEKQNDGFGFVELDWNKNTSGLLDFMEVFEKYQKNSKILEVCAGDGQYSLILRKKGFKNTVISDISRKGLIRAKEYLKGIKNSCIVLDAENIPFESNTFDIIFLTASLHHLQNPKKAIAEMKRCVKPGGLIIIAVEPNIWQYYLIRPLMKLLRIRRINKSKDLFSIGDEVTHGFSLRKLKKYFKKQNIKIIKTQRVWYLTGIVYYSADLIKRRFNKDILIDSEPMITSINPRIMVITLNIDRFIKNIPLINSLSFHNTLIGVKK